MKLHVPGIYPVPAAEYHADLLLDEPTLSHSIAVAITRQSPLHAWTEHKRLNPNYEAEEKETFDIGAAAHALLLEGEDRMVVLPFENYKKDAAQHARDAARAEGKHPVLEKRYADVVEMRDVALVAIAGCEDLSGLTLRSGRAEHTLLWKERGVVCRARPDFLFTGELVFLDYKTTTDATPWVFSRQIVRMGYHLQEDFYARGIKAIFGKRPKGVFMAQETREPYACSFHGCAPSVQDMAETENDHAIKTWAECLRTGRWPSHSNRIHWAEAKPWEMDEVEARGIPYDPAKLWEKPEQLVV
jgi:hypothetical protein